MMLRVAAILATGTIAGAALAADRPAIGPAPAWVRPVTAPAIPPPAAGGMPVRILLSDQQAVLEPGRQTLYAETVFSIQSPQGLAAGSISLPWRPDTDVLTVHKLLIRRGAQVVDVLKSGQTFTVLRREQNLESATLDGVLTANIQPEGLQVGDIVEVATSVASSDPTLMGHAEQFVGAWNGFPVDRAHLRVQWPATLPVRVRQTASLPPLKRTSSGALSVVEAQIDDLKPIVPPKGAPPRYAIGRLVELTDYGSWADLGALMAPLYVKAASIAPQGALRTELDRIKALSPDAGKRTEAALALVQDRVRYVALAMGAGGYVPADAETTWGRRYGDCKGKTALLLALLHEIGVEAVPVAVSTTFGDGLDARLPMVGLFNHVLVRATIAGRTYWLDGTRSGDTSLERLSIPDLGWGLPLIAQGAALVRMQPAPLAVPMQDVSIRIDASKGIAAPAPTRVETIIRGDTAIGTNAALANLAGEARDRALKAYWKEQYDFIEVTSATTGFDAATGELRLTMEGKATLDWANGNYQTDGTNVGYKADFSRDPGPERDAPYAVAYPIFNRTRETILLPKGAGEFRIGTGMEIDQTAGGIAYRRHATIADGIFEIERTERSVVPEFPAKDAPAAQAALRMLADRTASVRMPAGYRYSGADTDAVRAAVPTTSSGFVSRAKAFIARDLRTEALRDYDKAIELDPKNVYAWANRAMTRVQTGDFKGARSDLVEADRLDPDFDQIFVTRGMLADAENRPRDAIDAYTKVLQRDPSRSYALGHRAIALALIGEDDRAAADAAAAIQRDPSWIDLYSLRASLLIRRGEKDRALAEMGAAIAANPKLAFAHVAAARIAGEAGLASDAVRHLDDAVRLRPAAYIYAERSRFRPASDHAGRQADIDAALKLDRQSPEALAARAVLLRDQGDTKGAIAIWTRLLASYPTNLFIRRNRAQAYYAIGDDEHALSDSAAVLRADPRQIDIYLLRANIFQRTERRSDALLEAAAVTRAAPLDPYAYVVSGSIYNRFHEKTRAAEAYDRAIAIKPAAYIYLNRGQQRSRSDLAGRRADFYAALKLDPDSEDAVVEKGKIQIEDGDPTAAIATFSKALGAKAGDFELLTLRGIAYAKAGDRVRAAADLNKARAIASDPERLNYMCWEKATANVELESALIECNDALRSAPSDPGILDSRGLVQLRLARNAEAIADYDRALAKSPTLAPSLFGRAIARRRTGDQVRSAADMAAALKADPDIRAEFEAYGVTS